MFQEHTSISTAPSTQERPEASGVTRRQLLRALAAGSAVVAGGSALIGCGGNSDTTTVNVTFVTAAWPVDVMPTEAEQKKDPVKKAYADTLSKWLKNNPGVKLKHSAMNIWDTPGLTNAITAGTAPTWYMGDILGAFNKQSTRTAFTKGLAAEITSLVQQYKLGDLLSDWIVPAWKGWEIDGKYYSTPFGSGVGNGVFFRRDLIQQAGLKEPTTTWNWNDFRNYAKALTKGNVKGAALTWYTYGEVLGSHWLISSYDGYGTRGIVPAPNESWHWRYDVTSLQSEYEAATNIWRGMLNDDKSLISQSTNYGDGDVAQAFIRGDVAMMSVNTDFLTRSPDDPASVYQLAKNLKKEIVSDVIGYTSIPNGTNGAFGMTQIGLAVGSIDPHLQRDAAKLSKAFDFLVYMSLTDGAIDQIVGTYKATHDLKRVFTSIPPITKNRVKINGIPGTAEDAWGARIVQEIAEVAKIPVIPNAADYFQTEKNAGMTSNAFTDANTGLGFTQDSVASILSNLQNTINQQAASLSSSISTTDFINMTKKFYADLDAFWKQHAPTFYPKYHDWYTKKIAPALNG